MPSPPCAELVQASMRSPATSASAKARWTMSSPVTASGFVAGRIREPEPRPLPACSRRQARPRHAARRIGPRLCPRQQRQQARLGCRQHPLDAHWKPRRRRRMGACVMACQTVTLANGALAIVCGPRQPRERCRCGRAATLLCDWRLSPDDRVAAKKSITCDAPLCPKCTTSPAPGKDLCARHVSAFEAWKANRRPTISPH